MFETEILNGIPVLKAKDTHKINALNADLLKQMALSNLIANKALIIDFTNISYIDSTGFGAILNAYEFSRKNDKKLMLSGISHEVMGLFKITKLDEVFTIFPNADEAISSFE
jgi:anti-sigma B factor antagonist